MIEKGSLELIDIECRLKNLDIKNMLRKNQEQSICGLLQQVIPKEKKLFF